MLFPLKKQKKITSSLRVLSWMIVLLINNDSKYGRQISERAMGATGTQCV